MCGIAGILVASGSANPAAVRAMCDLMAHRGPDGDGFWQSDDGRVAFGHRRLAIIDLSRDAAQPMADTGGTLEITYNGEIYNYLEVRAELEAMGHRFRTQSDTEVILEAYRAWGPDCMGRLNGMFALAIWDRETRTLFCARDRFGEKPFLYAEGDGFFAFASEYKALLTLDGVDGSADERRLGGFFVDATRALDHGSETLFAGIRQLPAAHTLTLHLGEGRARIAPYWTAPSAAPDPAIGFETAAEGLRDLLRSSVELRMRADVPVGSCLSGGLDSGSIARLAAGLAGEGQPYHAFTGRFPGTDADEGIYAASIVRGTGIVDHEVAPSAAGLVDEMADFAWLNELPVNSASQYAQWCVFRLAREVGVTVLLDGQGGDEVLGGYEQYFAAYLAGRRASGGATDDEEAAIRARYPLALSMADQSWKRGLPLGLRKLVAKTLNRGSDVRFGMRRDHASEMDEPSTSLHAALTRDATNGFLTTLLRYGDRNSMAHSREVRLPFCDHRILEYVATLPDAYLMGDAETKRLLRRAMDGILPNDIRTRWLKQGFLPPIAIWLQGALGDLADDVFNDPAFARDPLWDAAWWRQVLARFRGGETALAQDIWKPLICHQWRRHFMARAAALPRLPVRV